jgi:DNA-binding NarL/FixJ family response regulator
MRKLNTIVICSRFQKVALQMQQFVRKINIPNEIVCVFTDKDLRARVKAYQPYLFFIDTNFWYENTAQIISNYAVKYPEMIITAFGYEPLSPGRIEKFVKLGVKNFVSLCDDDSKVLSDCIKICNSKTVRPPWLSTDYDFRSNGPEKTVLTKTEKQVLRLYALGNKSKDIAFKRRTTHGTAKNELTDIRKKLGMKSTDELLTYALTTGFVSADEIVNPSTHYTILEEEARAILTAE